MPTFDILGSCSHQLRTSWVVNSLIEKLGQDAENIEAAGNSK
jgi:hypothetical protein